MDAIYHNPAHHAAFGGRDVLQAASRSTKKETENFLLKDKVYRKFKQTRQKFDRARIFVSSIGHQLQADLMDLQKYSRQNKGFKYVLVVVDAFSRLTLARPLKNKSGPEVAYSMKDIFAELRSRNKLGAVVLLASDLGTEFWNKHADVVYKQFNVHHFALRPSKKCAMAENSGRWLLDRIYKWMEHKGHNKWVELLPEFVKAKNARPNSTIGMAPQDVTFDNQATVYQKLYPGEISKGNTPPLKIGTKVNMAMDKLPFHKSFHGYFSDKIYLVKHRVNYAGIYRYTLVDPEDNMEISGSFYAQELLPLKE
jgi:hypothetical protein